MLRFSALAGLARALPAQVPSSFSWIRHRPIVVAGLSMPILPGPCHSKAVHRLVHQYEAGTIEHDNADLVLKVHDACEAMQLHNIPHLSEKEILDHTALVAGSGVELPLEHKTHLTKKLPSDKLDGGMVDEWCARLWPWAAAPTDGSSDWDVASASFRCCCPQSLDEAQQIKFVDTWHSAVFCAGFMRAFSASTEGGAGPAQLLKLAAASWPPSRPVPTSLGGHRRRSPSQRRR